MTPSTAHIPPIVVVAFNRPHLLVRLLKSITAALEIGGLRTRTIVSVDDGTPEVVSAAKKFENHGVEVLARTSRLGLVEHVLRCGDLTYQYGPMLVLEDDLILSPAAFSFIVEALPAVQKQSRVAALSLYAFDFNEFAGLPLHKADCAGDVFYARTGSSWGQVWWPEKWREFRDWLQHEYDPSQKYRVPEIVSAWPESSWKRLYNCFLSAKGYYSAIPKASLALNDGLQGTHHVGRAAVSYSAVRSLAFPIKVFNLEDAMKLDEFLEYETEGLEMTLPSCGIRLCEIDFDVAGLKKKEDITKRYVFTARKQQSGRLIGEFDGQLGNPLLALSAGLTGSGLSLISREDFDDEGSLVRSHKQLRNYLGWLDDRGLVRLARHTLWSRLRGRVLEWF